MIKDYLMLSYSSLKSRRLRSWLTMIGIFIGIAAVVSLIGLGEGLRIAVTSQFNFLSTDVLTVRASGLEVGPPGTGVVTPITKKNAEEIERIKDVDMTIGRIIEDVKIEFNRRTDFTFAASMPDGEKRKEVQRIAQLEIDKGKMLEDSDKNRVVLGSNYAKSDIFGKAVKIRDKVIIQDKEFDVVGILKKKGSFIIDNAILMNEDFMEEFLGINDTYNVVLIKVNNVKDIPIVKEKVEEYMRDDRNVDKGEEDFTVESPEQALENLNSTLFAIQIFIYVIAGISIIVGGIGIANTMYTSVVERTRQIGIMKAIGARNKDIFILFLIESGFLGLTGGIIGIIIGVSIAYGLAFIGSSLLNSDLIKVSITWYLIFGSIAFSFIVGSIAGLMPAIRASKLKPVDALGYNK